MDTSIHKNTQGFTLIELSIVLVVIGLMVGGVLTGMDLIKAANIRSTVSQLEEYKTAVTTFAIKYNSLPGDILYTEAAATGLAARSGLPGHGDGNGRIEGCSANAMVAGCENTLFWDDLSRTQLIDGHYEGYDMIVNMSWLSRVPELMLALNPISTAHAMMAPPPAQVAARSGTLPSSSIGRGNFVVVYTAAGRNYFHIAGVTSTDGNGNYTVTNNLTPLEALAIDTKIDDSLAQHGSITAMQGINTLATPEFSSCVYDFGSDSGRPITYNTTTSSLGGSPLCQLRTVFN